MTRKQRQPDRRPGKTSRKKTGLAATIFGLSSIAFAAAGRSISRHPSLAAGGAAFLVVFLFVAANAVWYQPGGHPAPLLTTRVDFQPRPAVAPAPEPPRSSEEPREIASNDRAQPAAPAEAAPDGPRTIEDVLTPAPTRRVKSISFTRQDEDTPTASIPERPERAARAEPRRPSPTDDALVRDVQRELARLDLYEGAIDGLMGPRTSAALKAYGERSGLARRPEPSERLVARLRIANLDAVAKPRARPRRGSGDAVVETARPAMVHNVSTRTRHIPPLDVPVPAEARPSELVRKIQQGLANIAYSDVTVDGLMGSRTERAIRHFEKHYRLPETGEPSPAVLRKLVEIGAL